MKRYFIITIISAVMFFFTGVFVSNTFAETRTKELYVSKDGNDTWSGGLPSPNLDMTDGPFASLEKARDAIRALKVYGKLNQPVTVKVRGGTYFLNKTFTLEARDSGTRECPVKYMAYPGECVVLSGGKKIETGWKVYKDKIMVCTIPEVENRDWYFNQLFVNGTRQVRARIPNPDDDYFYIAGGVEVEDKEKTAFKFHQGNLKRWRNLNDAVLINYHSWDQAILRILDVDLNKNIVHFTGPTRWGFTAHQGLWGIQRYFVESVLEGLDQPGEWYLNRHTGELFYLPLEGENITDSEIVAPKLIELVRIQGNPADKEFVCYVTISGFTLCETDWKLAAEGYPGYQADVVGMTAGIVLSGAENCSIKNNLITNIGTYAVAVEDNCRYNSIKGNEIKDIGAGGIKVGTTERDDYSSKRNLISNNHIHNCGIIYNGAVGLWIGQSSQNTISHNEIHDINYTGISVGWTWNLAENPCYGNIIEFNEVYRVVKNANDGACIYMLGKQAGTVVRNNVFHDVSPYHHMGWGIYLDAETSNVTVMNNVVYRCEWGNSMNNPGKYNLWINNIFVNAKRGQIFWGSHDEKAYNRFMQNIVYYSDPEAYLIDSGGGSDTEKKMIEMDYNLYYYTQSTNPKDIKIRRHNVEENEGDIKSLEDWQKKGFDFHSMIADPMFVDIENDNYTLKPESPAFKLGFKQIDVSRAGRIK